jgi:3-methylcrotonyl-CoA carboxylase alpha subunit
VHRLCLPPADLARTDTGVREGDAVTPFYDAMIAKIIAWGEDRPAAVARLRRVLADTAVLGVKTNLAFLSRVMSHPAFAAAAVDTGFIERHRDALLRPTERAPDEAVAAAALARLRARRETSVRAAAASQDRFSPWWQTDGWRLGGIAPQDVVLHDGVERRTVESVPDTPGWRLGIDGRTVKASGEVLADGGFTLMLDGLARRVRVLDHDAETMVSIDGDSWLLVEIEALAPAAGEDPTAGKLTAPMPGRVTRVLVGPGAGISRGDPLMVIEAMKMEHTIVAPADGVVAAVRFGVGERVEEGAELITLAAPVGELG